ncbi:hypothetical protein BJ875DRAFT_529809 [Amylocarpus encephaloides]|uniref:Uncharacterized protein n=1 Tax=Amylocarpus encephaloides TaxID=45428 RepID=A0A9P7YKF2_9HELO|nr:hypothetical protein BJ875DRAFT_529809 [Amylocarpus encephaloides]
MYSIRCVSMLVGMLASIVASVPASTEKLRAAPPAEFTPNPTPGGGGNKYRDSPHFRIYNYPTTVVADGTLKYLEAAYSCFVDDLGWRSTGLTFNGELTDTGPWYKLNVYNVGNIPGAAANTGTESKTGLAFLNVVTQYLNTPSVVVHEFGHALTYCERYWVDQIRTGAWWETIANFVADTYLTSSVCANARAKYQQPEGDTLIDLGKSISDSYQVIVDGTSGSGNYYQAWPFFTYLTNNPDNYPGLGWSIFPNVWTKYKRNSNETPLHVLERLAAPTKIQTVVGRYWARMAYVDIGHKKAQQAFQKNRKSLNYANLDSMGSGRYKVKTARKPRYMGSNIIPLKGTGSIAVRVTTTNNAPFSAALAIWSANGTVRYIDLINGNAQAVLAASEEATLVVANTPSSLILFDPFKLTADLNNGLDYQIQLTGAAA